MSQKTLIPNVESRVSAFARLAVATRERFDKEAQAIYLDDTARYPTNVLVEACRRLETSSKWFPKIAELRDECGVVAREFQRREEAARPQLNAPPLSPDALLKFKERVRALVEAKRMPACNSCEPPPEWSEQ